MKNDLYSDVTNRIIAELEAGRLPWVKPWTTSGGLCIIPVNAVTGRAYSGVNILLLWDAIERGGFSCNKWLTFKQALDLGGNVRKGEKSIAFCVKMGTFVDKEEKAKSAETGKEARERAYLRRYALFNVEQCDNLPADVYAPPAPLAEHVRHAAAEAMIAQTGAVIHHAGGVAVYRRATDSIQLPPLGAFKTPADYYATAFHELGHWTRHETRLARDFGQKSRGDSAYAREELVAELTSAYVCAALNIAPIVRHADYIGDWLSVLKADNRAIFQAASFASKAADYIIRGQAAAGDVAGDREGDAVPIAARAPREKKPVSLAQFLVNAGGVRDDGGDVLHMIGDHRGRPGLINRRGLPIDAAIEAAAAAGYFLSELPTQREFLDALAGDLRGDKLYPEGDRSRVDELAALDRYGREFDRLHAIAAE